MATKPDFLELLKSLARHDVEHIIVGGVASILEGAPVTTLDVDVVYRVEDANLERLQNLLTELDARYRDPTGRTIRPTVDRLRGNRINLLETSKGLLDLLQEIGNGWTYDDLIDRTHRRELQGFEVVVLDLAAVIESKEAAGRAKDAATLPVLHQTLKLRDRRSE